jgi:hypothetical protein
VLFVIKKGIVMNVKKILLVGLCILMAQSISAIRIEIFNRSSDMIEVDPVWSGTTREFKELNLGETPLRYNSETHHLKGLLVKYPKNKCYYYFFEPYALRGTGKIAVTVNDYDEESRSCTITGHKDLLFQTKTKVQQNVEGKLIRCDLVNNFK